MYILFNYLIYKSALPSYFLQYKQKNQLIMAKREIWTQQKNKILLNFVQALHQPDSKRKWSQISKCLKKENASWRRSGKQCRQRWINQLNPKLTKSFGHERIHGDLFLRYYEEVGTKWSLMAKKFEVFSESQLKNYFYSSLKKGLKNLNFFNKSQKTETKHIEIKFEVIGKILSLKNQSKYKNLSLADESLALQLSGSKKKYDIGAIVALIKSSLLISSKILEERQFYFELNDQIKNFRKICRFKKSKSAAYQCIEKKKSSPFRIYRQKKFSFQAKATEQIQGQTIQEDKQSQYNGIKPILNSVLNQMAIELPSQCFKDKLNCFYEESIFDVLIAFN